MPDPYELRKGNLVFTKGPWYQCEDTTRLTRMNETKREACIKASEISGQQVYCGPVNQPDGISNEPWFWLHRVGDQRDYSKFWEVFRGPEKAK
jgi:hypothetical protein